MPHGDETRSHFESAQIRDALKSFFGTVQGLRNGPTDIDNTDVKIVCDLAQLMGVPVNVNVTVNPGAPVVTPYDVVGADREDDDGIAGEFLSLIRVVGQNPPSPGDWIDNTNEKDTWIQALELVISVNIEELADIANHPIDVNLILHNPDDTQQQRVRAWQGRKDWQVGFFDTDRENEFAKLFFTIAPHNQIGTGLTLPAHEPSMEYGPTGPIFVPGTPSPIFGDFPATLDFEVSVNQEDTTDTNVVWPATTTFSIRSLGYQPLTAGQLINFL